MEMKIYEKGELVKSSFERPNRINRELCRLLDGAVSSSILLDHTYIFIWERWDYFCTAYRICVDRYKTFDIRLKVLLRCQKDHYFFIKNRDVYIHQRDLILASLKTAKFAIDLIVPLKSLEEHGHYCALYKEIKYQIRAYNNVKNPVEMRVAIALILSRCPANFLCEQLRYLLIDEMHKLKP
jgi:hypothetical protein